MTLTRLILRRPSAGLLVVALACLAGLAAPSPPAQASAPVPVLTTISATHHRHHDQLVFQFAGSVPAHPSARYLSRLPGSSSGPHLNAAGRAHLLVTFSHTSGKNDRGLVAYGPSERSYALPGLIQVVAVPNHRNMISFVVGLAQREPFGVIVLAHLHRVVINVATPYQTVQVQDFFADSRSVYGTAPTRSVERPVIRPAAVPGALERLFAGPTQAEAARGLRFVASGATGFRRLTIRRGVARVHLTGGCSSGGSAITVATEIVPTLQQFPSVRWVKIYDPAGHTAQPAGRTDSIPACLKPSAAKLWTAQHKGPVLIALVILAALGILLGVVLSALSIVTGLARRPGLITPTAYRAERIKASPVGTGQFEPDLAWPFYPVRQVRADLARIEAERGARYRKLWNWPVKPIIVILLLPVSVAAVICLLVAGLTTVVLAALFALVTWVCAGIAAAAFGATVTLLRGAESGWHKMGTAATCPRCYHVTPRPAYRCPGCSELHRDLRPARLGLFSRRCECGTRLPTMVLRAAWRLEAVCQRCARPLRAGSGALRDIRISIFGDTSVGKTRFLYAGLDSLIDSTGRARIPCGFPDEESQNQATMALGLLRSGQDTVKTSATLPAALTCQVGKRTGRTLLHLFDTAGEFYRDGQMQDSLGFLDHSNGLVYVLDPFSIGSVRDQMAGQNAMPIRLAHAAAGDPETAYSEVVTRLRDSGVAAEGQRLAVVVSKADLLSAGALELPDDSDAIAGWLKRMGVHNLVLSAPREFAEVRYFAVASLAADGTTRAHDPGTPLRWLLAARGMRLPANPDATRSPRLPRNRNHQDDGGHVNTDKGETAKAKL